jgi:hypothetical protein
LAICLHRQGLDGACQIWSEGWIQRADRIQPRDSVREIAADQHRVIRLQYQAAD